MARDVDVAEEAGLPTVCASCGRRGDQAAGKDCEDQDWHLDLSDAEPLPAPALTGADLLAFVQRDRDALQDQVRVATQVIGAVLISMGEGARLVITDENLDATRGCTLTTWRDEGKRAWVYAVDRP